MYFAIKILLKRLYRFIITLGIIRSKKFSVNNNEVIFHNIRDNNLLIDISINGFESHESEVINLIKNYHWKLDQFYDIGSNVGHYAVIASLYHENTQVTAVEPFKLNYDYIKKLISNNNLTFDIIEKAVDSVSGETKEFYYPVSKKSSKLAATGTLINTFKGSGGIFNHIPYKIAYVETISIDSLIKNKKGHILIKMDCEGNEYQILKNSQILKSKNVDFIVEIMINDKDKDEIFRTMVNSGFNAFLITNGGLVHESRPLTFPKTTRSDRTLWRNHFFTKKPLKEIKDFSIKNYNYWI